MIPEWCFWAVGIPLALLTALLLKRYREMGSSE